MADAGDEFGKEVYDKGSRMLMDSIRTYLRNRNSQNGSREFSRGQNLPNGSEMSVEAPIGLAQPIQTGEASQSPVTPHVEMTKEPDTTVATVYLDDEMSRNAIFEELRARRVDAAKVNDPSRGYGLVIADHQQGQAFTALQQAISEQQRRQRQREVAATREDQSIADEFEHTQDIANTRENLQVTSAIDDDEQAARTAEKTDRDYNLEHTATECEEIAAAEYSAETIDRGAVNITDDLDISAR